MKARYVQARHVRMEVSATKILRVLYGKYCYEFVVMSIKIDLAHNDMLMTKKDKRYFAVVKSKHIPSCHLS